MTNTVEPKPKSKAGQPKKDNPLQSLTIRLDATERQYLTDIADKQGKSIGHVIRDIIAIYRLSAEE